MVSADSQAGWFATETLGGSRLRTNFRDVPNQIETFAKAASVEPRVFALMLGVEF